ncbi:MAG: radical SAM protein [Theionarchaea archaeon]|nr:radical SAM protein [Theionarchaea archaeon]
MLPIYEGSIWRPPSEARSLILQATIGCSNNTCTFCGSYKNKKFRIKPLDQLKADSHLVENYYKSVTRIFLADGDALVIKTQQLVDTLDFLYQEFPHLERVGVYASPQNLLQKSVDELIQLKEHGLGIIYLGVETGLDSLLEKVKKGVTRQQMITAGSKVVKAGIPLSVTIIIGLGGPELSEFHAKETASLLNHIKPDYTGALTLMVVEGTELHEQYTRGEFNLITPQETLQEMYWLIESLNCKTLFRSNHASNYLPLGGNLPEDKESLLRQIEAAQKRGVYKSEYLRGL